MRWSIVIASVLLLLSGCLSDEGAAEDVEGADGEETGRSRDPGGRDGGAGTHTLEATFPVTATLTRDPGGRTTLDTNCAKLDGVQRVLNGTITATWTPNKPVLQELELRLAGEGDAPIATGVSPLTITFEGVQPDVFGDYSVMVQGAAPVDVEVMQEVEIAVSLTYEGSEVVEVDNTWACSYS